jgi:hypothetical protein
VLIISFYTHTRYVESDIILYRISSQVTELLGVEVIIELGSVVGYIIPWCLTHCLTVARIQEMLSEMEIK